MTHAQFEADGLRLSFAMNSIISIGVENAECLAGETQSRPMGTSRMREISSVTFAAGSTPPWPGLAPCDSLISIILISGLVACAANLSGEKVPS
jgi:hypothetical protein